MSCQRVQYRCQPRCNDQQVPHFKETKVSKAGNFVAVDSDKLVASNFRSVEVVILWLITVLS